MGRWRLSSTRLWSSKMTNLLCCVLNVFDGCDACGIKCCRSCIDKPGRILHLQKVLGMNENSFRFCPNAQTIVIRYRGLWSPYEP